MRNVSFNSADGQLETNAQLLLAHYRIRDFSGIPMTGFDIESDSHYSSADQCKESDEEIHFIVSLLYHFFCCETKSRFYINAEHKEMIWEYFGLRICEDALNNPNTKHKSVRCLLEKDAYVVIRTPK